MLFLPIAVPTAPPFRSSNQVVMIGGIGIASSTCADVLRRPWFSSLSSTQGSSFEQAHSEPPVTELRRRSGLTWDQLATTMGVERRTLHLWEAGRGMRPVHEERLQQVLLVIRKADRGSASATRAALLDSSRGPSVKELLSQDRFEEALQRARALPEATTLPKPSRLTGKAKEARRPLPLPTQIALKEDVFEPVSMPQARPARITRVQKS